MTTLRLLVLLVTACAPSVLGIHYHDCGSNGAAISAVNIQPCGNGPTCVLTRGKNATLTITFTSKEASKSATSSVHGKVTGVPIFVPFDLPNADACAAAGLSCPLEKGSVQHYKQAIEIKRIFPAVGALVKWEILDDSKGDIVCLLIPVRLR